MALLEPHLKWNNYRKLIRASIGKSTREMEALVAALSPVPTEPIDRIRFLTVEASVPPAEAADFFTQTPMSEPQGIAPPTTVPQEAPAAPGAPQTSAVRRVHFSFTGDEDLLHGYERAKELSRHKWAGRMEDVFGGAIKALLEKIDPDQRQRRKERARRLAAGRRSRGIAATVKDVVWRRDGGRCSYQSEESRACGARAGLEFDHVRPWALGGSSDPVNVRLLCRAHNQLEARRVFGDAKIDAAIGASRGTSGRTEGGR
ncbi:MAG: HNH endonuclease [Elusimicrobia bacterium]|nr:HNH endonuclease [Elusimicrobiota bacterium]